ncbi:FAD-dependent oxidoreductase [Halobacterium sp. CBA1126]|uniref:FAD-dependent oxidoreductase n=1 Tax=Halobacterium sp. CBA1126 TaxID=2668074 RepID=UPI0012F8D184|nr:FAD-dependent oxidoreductase [Halobacterium sp. CBA1126]MUV59337.1 FAD-dependent oxidoreductase [Halobacterium sp. CBA1126]
MDGKVDSVVVVGGGDVGLLTALGVRRMNPSVDVSVVDDFQQEIPQVGKSTYREIQSILHGSLGIDEHQFISEVKPIWKASVYFRDWCDRPSFQYPFDPPDKYPNADTPDAVEHYYYHYDELYDSPDHLTRDEQIVAQGKSPWFYGSDGDLDRYDKVAYHLDTNRFNTYLRKLCHARDVSLVNDEVTAVETTGQRIDRVRSDRCAYEADLYVDATGFNRVLRSEQDVEFREFEFPLDAALNVRVDRSLSEVVPATVIETGDHGWFWQIDTYDDRDLGYVFATEYADEATARAEFREFVADVAPGDADSETVVDDADVDRYDFDSGYYDRAWVANCLAIGNAEGFVEPLQSTALTANASLAVQFSNLLASHGRVADDDVRDAFNASVRRTWESIHDFVGVHYEYSSGDTPFWEAMESLDVSSRVDQIAEEFDRYGYDWNVDVADPSRLAELKVFALPDFYTVMRNMGATSEFYETNDFDVSDDVADERDRFYRQTEQRVADDHLTVEELYRGIMDF